jgi:hypothetical protein
MGVMHEKSETSAATLRLFLAILPLTLGNGPHFEDAAILENRSGINRDCTMAVTTEIRPCSRDYFPA